MEQTKASPAPLRSRATGEFVTLTNKRTHVVNLLGDGHGEPPVHLIPGVPNSKVPAYFLEHEQVKEMLEAGDLVKGTAGASKEAQAAVADVNFADPEGTKARGRQRAAQRAQAADLAAGAAGTAAPPVPPADDGSAGAGSGKKPWEA